jgi:hypothetical protein
VCKVARYHGPLVLELKPDVPGVSRASAERFRPGPACPGFQPAWESRQCSADVELLAGDGSCQRVHKLVLQCRLPVLQGQPVAAEVEQVSSSSHSSVGLGRVSRSSRLSSNNNAMCCLSSMLCPGSVAQVFFGLRLLSLLPGCCAGAAVVCA